MASPEQTVVIKRGKKHKHKPHGGSWKIAFADFALAMMAFFLVLWLMETTTELEKIMISGYFSDPRSLASTGDGGTPYVLDLGGRPLDLANQGLNVNLVRDDLDVRTEPPPELEIEEYVELARLRQIEDMRALREQLEQALEGNQELEWISDNVILQPTEEGLSIQIVDRENRPMFDMGESELRPYALEILWTIARVLNTVPNKLSVYGHTDSTPFSSNLGEYTNWELSSDRANAARRALVEGGLGYERFAQIIGMGSSIPFDEENPRNPANRRIVILVMNQLAENRLMRSTRGSEAAGSLDPAALPAAAPLELF